MRENYCLSLADENFRLVVVEYYLDVESSFLRMAFCVRKYC